MYCNRCNMYRILILFLVFGNVISYNIDLYEMKIQAVGHNNLKISFRIRHMIDHLTGHFSAHHRDCPNGQCGSINTGPISKNDQGKQIAIQLRFHLSPCKSYDRIEVRAPLTTGAQVKNYANWKAISCPHLTTTTTTTTTTSTASSPQPHQDNISGTH